MKIKIDPEHRKKCEEGLAVLAKQSSEAIAKWRELKRLEALVVKIRTDNASELRTIKLDDDEAILKSLINQRRHDLAVNMHSPLDWELDHSAEKFNDLHRSALSLVSHPANEVMAHLVRDYVGKLTPTTGKRDAEKFAADAEPVVEVRSYVAKKFIRDTSQTDMVLEACERIVIFLRAYLSGEWNHAEVIQAMDQIGAVGN